MIFRLEKCDRCDWRRRKSCCKFGVRQEMDLAYPLFILVNFSVVFFLMVLILLCLKIKTTKKTPELLGTVGTVKKFDEDGLLSQHNDTSTNLTVQQQLNSSHNSTGPLVSHGLSIFKVNKCDNFKLFLRSSFRHHWPRVQPVLGILPLLVTRLRPVLFIRIITGKFF